MLSATHQFTKFHHKVVFKSGMSLDDFAAEVLEGLRIAKIVQTIGVDKTIDLDQFWDRVSEQIGDCLLLSEDPFTGQRIGKKWGEIRYDPAIPNAYRHSKNAQPLHTDGSYVGDSPYISFFYCINQAAEGGATVFYDSEELITLLKAEDPKLYQDLCNTSIRFAKDKDFKHRPIIEFDDRGPNLNWNYYCIDPEESDFAKELVERFHTFLQTKVVGEDLTYPIKLNPEEAVFFHDNRLIHGRKSFRATQPSERFFWKSALKLRD